MGDFDEYVTTNEAAEILGLTPAALRRRARAGQLGATKRGGVWWYTREAVERYAQLVNGKTLNDPTRGREEEQPEVE